MAFFYSHFYGPELYCINTEFFVFSKGGGLKEEDLMKCNGSTTLQWENGHAFHDIEARDSGHAILQKVGVNNCGYGRTEILGKKFVHTLLDIQTKISNFSEDKEI
jgi:hypothetical protein